MRSRCLNLLETLFRTMLWHTWLWKRY